MPASVPLRPDFDAANLRLFAKRCADSRQTRRLLALAAVYDGMSRAEAARVGGMDRQTLRDWVHRFNDEGMDGLTNRKGAGRRRLLSDKQMKELGEIVETGPDLAVDGVVRWRRIDLKRVIESALTSSIPSAAYPDCLANWALPVSARARSIPSRMSASSQRSKKLRQHARGAYSELASANTDRNLVPGRSKAGAEKWPDAAMGEEGVAPPPTRRSTVSERLSVWSHLSKTRNRCSTHAALGKHPDNAAASR